MHQVLGTWYVKYKIRHTQTCLQWFGTVVEQYVALSDPDYMKFQQRLGHFLVDWRTTMNASGFLTIFQECCHICYSWKIVRNPFLCMVFVSNPQGKGKCLFHTFKEEKGPFLWIREEPCLQINFWQFSSNAEIQVIPRNWWKSICMHGCSLIHEERSSSLFEFHLVRIWECNICGAQVALLQNTAGHRLKGPKIRGEKV